MQQIGNKSSETRIGFAVMFKFFQYEARFPFHKTTWNEEIHQPILERIGQDLKLGTIVAAICGATEALRIWDT